MRAAEAPEASIKHRPAETVSVIAVLGRAGLHRIVDRDPPKVAVIVRPK
jgi:hypothetical protein